jgi:hypothetical protein
VSLSNKRQAFINEYLCTWNATEAARRAGYAHPNKQGPRLLVNVGIAKDIRQRINEKAMAADEVLQGLADIARGDMADLMEITTSGFTLSLMVDDGNGNKIINPKTKLIKKIKQKVTTYLAKKEDDEDREVIETELELYSAHDAYRDIGRHHALFTDNTDITSNGETLTWREFIEGKKSE